MIRTLIVDDDPFVRMSLQTILEAQDDVEVCALGADGDEAVELFERERPDVLLMDIQMPGSDGLGAAERILGAHKHARIVFLTTFSDDEYIVRALRLGRRATSSSRKWPPSRRPCARSWPVRACLAARCLIAWTSL